MKSAKCAIIVAVRLGLLVERNGGCRRCAAQAFDGDLVRVVPAPVEQHVADVELVRLGRRGDVVGAGRSSRLAVDGDLVGAVGSDLHPAAVDDVDGAHVRVPEREVVLGHPVRADPAADDVLLVAGDRDHPVDRVGVVDAPAGAGDPPPSTSCASRVMLVTLGRSGSWLRGPHRGGEHDLLVRRVEALAHRVGTASRGPARSRRPSRYAARTVGCSISSRAASSCSCCSAVATGCCGTCAET